MARPLDPTIDRAITEATLTLLRERGFARMSMEAVASVAGVGKPAIYRRFRDKAALVATVIDGQLPQLELPDLGDTRAELWMGVEQRLPRRRARLRRADRRPDRRAGTPPRADRGVPAQRAAPAPRDRAGRDRARPGARRHPRRHPVRGGAGPARRPPARPRVRGRGHRPAVAASRPSTPGGPSSEPPKGTPHDRLHRRDADRPPRPRRLRLRDRPGPALHLADQHRLRHARGRRPLRRRQPPARGPPRARRQGARVRRRGRRVRARPRLRARGQGGHADPRPHHVRARRRRHPRCASARTASSAGRPGSMEPLLARMLRKQFAQNVATLKQVLEGAPLAA